MLTFALCLVGAACAVSSWSVALQRENNGKPLKLKSGSLYTYNPSWVPGGLFVRVQNLTANAQNGFDVGPSAIAFAAARGPLQFGRVTTVLSRNGSSENFGVEDPRVIESNGKFFMLYSAVEQNATAVTSRLALATSTTPGVADSWVRHGALFDFWSKSGALLLQPQPPHYLFFGDSSLVPGLQWALAADPRGPWRVQPGLWLPVRSGAWDSNLVEAGPAPLPLASGHLFMVYNSARRGFPSNKPGFDFQYNCGWLILNGSDPSQILARSAVPLLSPQLAWELGVPPALELTPNVVFCEGIEPLGPNSFRIYYGGADSVVGVARVDVTEM